MKAIIASHPVKTSVIVRGHQVILFLFITLLTACSENKRPESTHPVLALGESRLEVPGGSIWFKVTGNGKGIPVVLLHGGPGASSFYLKPFEKLGDDRQVIRYDQLGGGKSDVITDTALFTIDHFVQELDLLREHLELPSWHVLGHSWGTTLAMEYYRRFPDRVATLVLGSPCLSASDWAQSTKQLLTLFPDSIQEAVLRAETTGNYEDPLYQEAIDQFYARHLWGTNPVQTDLDSIQATFNIDVYGYMWGPSEFSVTGTLGDYEATSFLPDVKVPTLFTVGELDEIIPDMVRGYAGKVVDSRFSVFPGSSHMTSWDAPDESVRVVREFLNEVDSPKE